ncbi:MAG TPA: sulfatase-like hydrolase/transferase [Planctomycetota bacterium]|nr:sulfatase-like hydrolase/transferase [Planctomycetota bacterium]
MDTAGEDLWTLGVIEQNRRWLLAYVRAVVGDAAAAEDLVQETFLTAYRKRGEFRRGELFGAWLCGIARNLARRHLEQRSRGPVLLLSDEAWTALDARAATLEIAHFTPAFETERVSLLRRCVQQAHRPHPRPHRGPLRPDGSRDSAGAVPAPAAPETRNFNPSGVGPGRAGVRRRAAEAGLRLLLRIPLPAEGARVLSRIPLAQRREGALDGKTYSHDLFAAESLDFVRKNRDQPFFLDLPFTIPHGKVEVPDAAPYAGEPWPEPQKNIAAMITRMDRDIGRLLDLLKELKLEENTLVFFASDNGAGYSPKMFASSGELRGMKRDLYEGGIRVPMIARWTGTIAPGGVSDQPWAFWDFLPTMAELLGVKAPAVLDGLSVLPALPGGKVPEREYFYWEFHEKGFSQAVRMGNLKAVKKAVAAPTEIHDLQADPSEKTDLAGSRPEVVQKAASLFTSARTESELWPVKPSKTGKQLPPRRIPRSSSQDLRVALRDGQGPGARRAAR